jgi:drug/metabolite transporter (DMT)-like permease
MPALALGLVLAAAVAHAGWNVLAKKAGGGVGFVWLYSALGAVMWAPVALGVVLVARPHVGLAGAAFMAGSGALHATYFVALQRAYADGDLSVVYPLARGLGPLISTAAAIAILGERPGPVAVAGAILITASVLALAARGAALHPGPEPRAGLAWAVATGVLIGAYTLWDKHAVDGLAQEPILYLWGGNVCWALLLAPFALRRPGELTRERRINMRGALGVALLAPVAYVLVLFALRIAPVSYVAPAREVSILFGAAMGSRLLGEGDSAWRLAAASAIALGILGLAVG